VGFLKFAPLPFMSCLAAIIDEEEVWEAHSQLQTNTEFWEGEDAKRSTFEQLWPSDA